MGAVDRALGDEELPPFVVGVAGEQGVVEIEEDEFHFRCKLQVQVTSIQARGRLAAVEPEFAQFVGAPEGEGEVVFAADGALFGA